MTSIRPQLAADRDESRRELPVGPPDDSQKPGQAFRRPSEKELDSVQAQRGWTSHNPLYAQYMNGVRD